MCSFSSVSQYIHSSESAAVSNPHLDGASETSNRRKRNSREKGSVTFSLDEKEDGHTVGRISTATSSTTNHFQRRDNNTVAIANTLISTLQGMPAGPFQGDVMPRSQPVSAASLVCPTSTEEKQPRMSLEIMNRLREFVVNRNDK